MNLLIFAPEEVQNGTAVLRDQRRLNHIREVLKTEPEQTLRAGILNGAIGTAVLEEDTVVSMRFSLTLNAPPPPKIPATLILALPRPKTLKKALHCAICCGCERIILINSARTDKSYWTAPILREPDLMNELILEALEQARDTVVPEIQTYPLFRPFTEDILPGLFPENAHKIILHPLENAPHLEPVPDERPFVYVIGAEGGFVPFELELFARANFHCYRMGERILRVEQAVCAAFARLCKTL